MKLFVCEKCNKAFNHKGTYQRHLKRKTPCSLITETVAGKRIPDDRKVTVPVLASLEIKSDIDINNTKFCDQLHESCSDSLKTKSDVVKGRGKFSCSDCVQVFSTKSNMLRHKKQYCKKNLCADLNHTNSGSEDRDECKDLVEDTGSKISEICDSDLHTNSTQNTQKNRVIDKICGYCGLKFSRVYSLNRHIEKYCKEKKKIALKNREIYEELLETYKQQIATLKDENSLLRASGNPNVLSTTNNIVNNNGDTVTNNNNVVNINNTNNFTLVSFGKEDLNSFGDSTIKKLIKKGFMSVPKFVEHVHFNKNKPQFHNVYIPNIKEPYAAVHDGGKWALANKTDVIRALYEDKKYHLETKFEEFYNTLDPVAKKKFKRFIEQVEDNSTIEENIKQEIKLLLYNNRDVTLETKKKLIK